MFKILLINIQIYLNININKQTNIENVFLAKVKVLRCRCMYFHVSGQEYITVNNDFND